MKKRRSTAQRPTGSRVLAFGLLAAVVVLVTAPAVSAHIPVVRGKLVGLVQRSDVIVIGSAKKVDSIGARTVDTTIAVEQVLVGSLAQPEVTFRGPTWFAPAKRYVFFLRRAGSGFAGVQDSGTVFPAPPEDDTMYRGTINLLTQALHADGAGQSDQVRAALIPALSASAAPLRYHAALELTALAQRGHQLNPTECATLERLLAAPTTDPALRPLLGDLVHSATRAGSSESCQTTP